MSNNDFRRELNSTFDQMTGSPSPSLRDRVRSSVGQAPERRGPYWMAAAAAAVIAVLGGTIRRAVWCDTARTAPPTTATSIPTSSGARRPNQVAGPPDPRIRGLRAGTSG